MPVSATTPNHLSWTDVPPPALSAGLRALVERMDARLDSLAQSVGQVIFATIPDYGLATDPTLRETQLHAARINARLWHRTLLTGKPPTEAEFAQVAEHSRRRVHQGVSLSALLRAYRIGSRTLWMEMLKEAVSDGELQKELLVSVSPYFMHHFDLTAQFMAQAYTAEQFQQERWRDRLRSELWMVVSMRPDDGETFRRHATELGLDPTAPVCAVALRPTTPLSTTANVERMIDVMVTQVARAIASGRESFMRAVHHDQLVLWLPAGRGELPIDHNRRVNGLAADIGRQLPSLAAVGIGLPGNGPAGWYASAEQALRAQGFPALAGEGPALVCYSDVVLDDLVTTRDNVKQFFDSLIGRLAVEPHLLETLSKYFELKQHRKAVAGALNVHPNTLDHRLERIEQILGANLGDVAWMAKLHTALRSTRRDRHQDA